MIDAVKITKANVSRGIEVEVLKEFFACEFARENKLPYFGICLGMQIAIIEFSRNVLKLKMQIVLNLTSRLNIRLLDW